MAPPVVEAEDSIANLFKPNSPQMEFKLAMTMKILALKGYKIV